MLCSKTAVRTAVLHGAVAPDIGLAVPMTSRDDVLNVVLPHRLDAIATLNLLIRLRMKWKTPRPMEVRFDDQIQFTGNSSAFTNPVIEAGLIHCRALLEFVGLGASPDDPKKLVQRGAKRRRDDWAIEHFSNAAGPLPMVTPKRAISKCKGDPAEAEKALAAVLHVANKALAHITSAPGGTIDIELLEIASRGVPAILTSFFYTPLGLTPPTPNISSRARNDG